MRDGNAPRSLAQDTTRPAPPAPNLHSSAALHRTTDPPTAARRRAAAPLTATLSVAYLGVFPTAVAFTTWAYALARTPASKMGATTYLVPALTVPMAWAILGQIPGWLALAGGTLCLAGVALSRRRPARRGAAAPRPGHPARARQPPSLPIWPRAGLLARSPTDTASPDGGRPPA